MNSSDHLGMYISIASMHIRRNFDALFTQYGCSSGIQGRVLAELVRAEQEQKDIYQKDMEKTFGIRRSSVNSLIANLESHGFLKRIQDGADARLKKLELTDAGRELHQKICEDITRFEKSLADEFSESEREEFIRMLKRVVEHYHSDSETE